MFGVVAGLEFGTIDVFLLYIVYIMYLVMMGVLVSGANRNIRFLKACQRLVWLVEQQNLGGARPDEEELRRLPGARKLKVRGRGSM